MRFTLVVALLVSACTVRDADSVRHVDSIPAAQPPVPSAGSTVPPGAAPLAGDADVAPPTPLGRDVDYYPAGALSHVADSLSHGTTTGHMLASHGSLQYLQIRRAASGVPEIHDRWTDVTMVQAGRGTLRYGGHVVGGALRSAGEHRGGTIEDGLRRAVAPGDLMIIPAGTPHQYEIARGDSLRYLTVKVLSAGR